MKVEIDISDKELSADDKTLIKDCLGLRTDNEFDISLKKLCKTALMEYVKMFKEKGLPTRADEVLQERLFFLLTYYYQNRLPGENEISSVFQLTPSQSKTLLRNTKSRYRTKILAFIRNTLRDTLNSAAKPSGSRLQYEFVCTSPSTVEELNSIVSPKRPNVAAHRENKRIGG